MAHLHATVTALLRCSGTRAAVTLGDDLASPLQDCKCTFWRGCVLQFLQACDLPGSLMSKQHLGHGCAAVGCTACASLQGASCAYETHGS